MLSGLYTNSFVNEFLRHVSSRSGWTATLWTQSSIGLLEELLCAGANVPRDILSEASFDELKAQVLTRVKEDPGFGIERDRNLLLGRLPRSSREFFPGSSKYKIIDSIVPTISADYLKNWSTELGGPAYGDINGPDFPEAFDASRAAALIGAYMLHLGPSASYLARWTDYRIRHAPGPVSLAAFVNELDHLRQSGYGTIQLLVGLVRPFVESARTGPGWVNAKEAKEWLGDRGFVAPRTIHGGILITTQQWDIDGAVAHTSRALDRLSRRARIATGAEPVFHDKIWIEGVSSPRPLAEKDNPAYRARSYAMPLSTTASTTSADRLEVAIDFLQAGLRDSSPTAAGLLWAAIESLLNAPGDANKTVLIDRAVDMAVVAFVRSEIANLIGVVRSRCRGDQLALEIDMLAPPERLRRIERALREDELVAVPNPYVRLVASHARKVLEPTYLKEVSLEFSQVLRGLYRQRNLVLHGGVTDAPLLPGVLRAAAPIVVSVVNRYAASSKSVPDPHLSAFQHRRMLEEFEADPTDLVHTFWGGAPSESDD